MLQIAGDTHTHTLFCNHAYSTVTENATQAAALGHRFLAVTDHGPAMQKMELDWYFDCMRATLPATLCGIALLCGCEANILADGSLDLRDKILGKLDWVIASMHRGEHLMPVGRSVQDYTAAWLKAAQNPYIDCMGHMGSPYFVCDYKTVIEAVAANGKVVEINASSPRSRPGCEENCRQIIRLCKEYEVPLVLSSDAHFYTAIGQVEWAAQAVTAEGYPTQNILNLDYDRMRRWLHNKKGLELPD